MPKFMIQETITRDYIIEAENFDDALHKACNEINDSWDYDEQGLGFTYMVNLDTNEDKIL